VYIVGVTVVFPRHFSWRYLNGEKDMQHHVNPAMYWPRCFPCPQAGLLVAWKSY